MENTEQDNDDLLLDTSMSPVERLVKLSKSKRLLQRLVAAREVSVVIYNIEIYDAVEHILPVIIALSKDEEDAVREALATDIDKIMNYYYTHAPPSSHTPSIPPHSFAPILIDFLLEQNTSLASLAQQAIVAIAFKLADTPTTADNYQVDQKLLDTEIYDGILVGLLDIIHGRKLLDSFSSDINEDESIYSIKPKGNDIFLLRSPSIADKKINKTKQYDEGGLNLAKMVCLMLVSALADVFGADRCTEKFLPIIEEMINDQMFYVRKEAAGAVGSLAGIVPPNITLTKLIPIYSTLSKDTIWHVRRACLVILPALCEVLPLEMKKRMAVEGVEMFQNDVSKSVRNTLADIMGELISKFLPDDWKQTNMPGEVPKELLDYFISLGNALTSSQICKMDTDRAYNCAYNFPAVVLTTGVEYWDSHLKETYLNLTKDYQIKVRKSFAHSLHDIARIIGPERTERDLVQIFALYLMDLDDVKQGVLEHLADFLGVLAISSRNEYIPILAEVWDGVMVNWYLRDILTSQLRDIAKLFDASRVVEHILPLAIRACHDEFAAVRETGVEIFPVILEIVKRTVDEDGESLSNVDDLDGENDSVFERKQKYALALLNHVMEKLDELVRSDSYRTRLVFTQICRSLLQAGIDAGDFASFFLLRLLPLSKDRVVNVRIATSRTVYMICTFGGYRADIESITFSDVNESSNPKQILENILYNLISDRDRDVRYYVTECVSSEVYEQFIERKREGDGYLNKMATIPEYTDVVDDAECDPPVLNTPLSDHQEDIDVDYNIELEPDNNSVSLMNELLKKEEESKTEGINSEEKTESVVPLNGVNSHPVAEDEMMTDDLDMQEVQEIAEIAQHVYLAKVPAHMILNNSNTYSS
ncbi:armadillo-type protein [Pilobolus umbonatus]|nr:armadillo-type protein [Pilobolus umbonatus]